MYSQGKKGSNENFDEDDDNGLMNKSLSERLGTLAASTASPDLKPKGKKRAPKAPREKKPSGSPRKGGKKRNPWSDSEDEQDVSDFSDMDNGFGNVVIPRDTAVPRRNAGECEGGRKGQQ